MNKKCFNSWKRVLIKKINLCRRFILSQHSDGSMDSPPLPLYSSYVHCLKNLDLTDFGKATISLRSHYSMLRGKTLFKCMWCPPQPVHSLLLLGTTELKANGSFFLLETILNSKTTFDASLELKYSWLENVLVQNVEIGLFAIHFGAKLDCETEVLNVFRIHSFRQAGINFSSSYYVNAHARKRNFRFVFPRSMPIMEIFLNCDSKGTKYFIYLGQ